MTPDSVNPGSETPVHDLLGNVVSTDERELLDIYLRLKELSTRTDMPPCALMNTRQAMVLLWNACNDLGLVFEEPGCD